MERDILDVYVTYRSTVSDFILKSMRIQEIVMHSNTSEIVSFLTVTKTFIKIKVHDKKLNKLDIHYDNIYFNHMSNYPFYLSAKNTFTRRYTSVTNVCA